MTMPKYNEPIEIELSRFYGDKGHHDLMATVSINFNKDYFVDFYKDEVIVDSRRLAGVTQRYAEDLAENFVSGIIRLDPKTRRVNGV